MLILCNNIKNYLCVIDIDEIIDFKIQYKERFSFIKKGNKFSQK